jgi:hypothetical protein
MFKNKNEKHPKEKTTFYSNLFANREKRIKILKKGKIGNFPENRVALGTLPLRSPSSTFAPTIGRVAARTDPPLRQTHSISML